MKKLLVSLLFFSSSLMAYPQCSPQLASPLQKIYQLEEMRQLISQVESSGPIAINAAQLGTQMTNAAWYPDERTIYVNFSIQRSEGSLIRSIVFELHNAQNQRHFDYYDQLAKQGRISREKYIESVEHLEYQNGCRAAQILNKGISKGLFPKDSQLCNASSFQEHFDFQMKMGHSQLIGSVYDELAQSRR